MYTITSSVYIFAVLCCAVVVLGREVLIKHRIPLGPGQLVKYWKPVCGRGGLSLLNSSPKWPKTYQNLI